MRTNNIQAQIDFSSPSPINTERLSGQNLRLHTYLQTGATIHCMHPAIRDLRIGYLNSRISDCIKAGVIIYKRMIKVKDIEGVYIDVKEYSEFPFPCS